MLQLKQIKSQHGHTQQGMVSVEMAIATAFLMFVMLGAAEFSRLFYQYNELTKSVRTAARYLSENALTSAGQFSVTAADETKVKNLVVYGNVSGSGTTEFSGLSTSDVTITDDGKHVVVRVAWVYQSIWGTPLPTFGLSEENNEINTNLTLQASLAMRALN